MVPASDPPAGPGSEQARADVRCARCGAEAHVPFTPTPGRAVYCRRCFQERSPDGPRRRAGPLPRPEPTPKRSMLSMGRKGHFVHDAREALEETGVDEAQRRTFIEMVFSRGARLGTRAAVAFLDEKQADGTLSPQENDRLARLVERYSERR